MPPRFNIPPLTRTLLLTTVGQSVIYAGLKYKMWMTEADSTSRPNASGAIPYITVVPPQSIFFPWTFFTATFVEGNIFTLIIALNTIFYGGRYLERAWGSKEFAKFIAVVSGLSNALVLTELYLWHVLTGSTDKLPSLYISGGTALLTSFLVSFKQLVPEHTVTLFRSPLSLRVKHFPLLVLVLLSLPAVLYPSPTATIVPSLLAWAGFLVSWTYLRFFKKFFPDLSTSTTPLRGDASETFSFAAFFPEPLSTPVNTICTKVFDLLVLIKVCTPFSQEDVEAGNARVEMGNIGRQVGGARAEAERRRALALRALDARLAGTGGGRATAPLTGVTVENASNGGRS